MLVYLRGCNTQHEYNTCDVALTVLKDCHKSDAELSSCRFARDCARGTHHREPLQTPVRKRHCHTHTHTTHTEYTEKPFLPSLPPSPLPSLCPPRPLGSSAHSLSHNLSHSPTHTHAHTHTLSLSHLLHRAAERGLEGGADAAEDTSHGIEGAHLVGAEKGGGLGDEGVGEEVGVGANAVDGGILPRLEPESVEQVVCRLPVVERLGEGGGPAWRVMESGEGRGARWVVRKVEKLG